jgi:hypothetical protein
MIRWLQRPPRIVPNKDVPAPSRKNAKQAPEKVADRVRRKSWPLKPGPLCPNEDVVLAAMRAAQAQPAPLSAEEEATFAAFQGRGDIGNYRPVEVERDGKIAYRRPGQPGAPLPLPPAEWDLRQLMETHRRSTFPKAKRQAPDPRLGARARDAKAKIRATPVIEALARYVGPSHKCCKVVAAETGERIAYVRRIRREKRSRRTGQSTS